MVETEGSQGSSVERGEVMDAGYGEGKNFTVRLVEHIPPWQWSKVPWMKLGTAKLPSPIFQV